MAHTIKISDGTTTVDLLSTNYKILTGGGWSPRRAQLRANKKSGQSPYTDVVESMAISIKGSSESDCLDKLNDLSTLMEQVDAWRENPDANDVVYLEYEPDGSALGSSVKAAIIGPPYAAEYITLPSNFTFIYRNGRYLLGTVDDPIILAFVRRGLWLGATEAESAATSTGNPAVATTSLFTNTMQALCPYDVDITFSSTMGGSSQMDMYIMTANAGNKLLLIEAEGMTGANSQAVAGSSAGSVHQQSDAASATIYDGAIGVNSDARLFAVYAVVKCSATSTTWTITPSFYYNTLANWPTAASQVSGRETNVGGTANIQVVFLGIIGASYPVGEFHCSIIPDANNGETINVDYFCIAALDGSTNIIKVVGPNAGTGYLGDELLIEHREDDNTIPQVTLLNSSSVYFYPVYSGNATPHGNGASVSSLVFGGAPLGYVLKTSGAAEANYTLSVTRHDSYLTPV